MILFGVLGVIVFGFGIVVFMFPFLPFALLAFVIWKLLRRPRSAPVIH